MSETKKGLVIIPTYNELGNIEFLIPKILLYKNLDVFVVDDSSPDGTADFVKEMPLFGDRIFVMVRKSSRGLGKAYIDAFKKALNMDYDFVVQMDADFSHNPEDLEIFMRNLKKNAVVFGSRYIEGGGFVNWGYKRWLLSIFGNRYAQIVTGIPLSDLTGGYNAYSMTVLYAINFDTICASGYMFQIELKAKVYALNVSIIEIPIIFTDRTVGKTKMRGAIIFEALIGCLLLRFCSMF